MDKFDNEVIELSKLAGANAQRHPLKWIRWESSYISPSGTHAPPWREAEGDYGIVIVSTHDAGIVIILCKQNGKCLKIKGYSIEKKSASEELNYEEDGPEMKSIVDVLHDISKHFDSTYDAKVKGEISDSENLAVSREIAQNSLVSLPQPVLVLRQPESPTGEEDAEENQPEDDEKIVQFNKPSSTEGEYWSLHAKLKALGNPETSDPTNNDLKELSENPVFKEASGQRAIYSTGSIPALRDILRFKQTHNYGDTRTTQQIYALRIFAMISLNALIRRHLANQDFVNLLFDLLRREEMTLMPDLLTTIANCCHNTAFRNFFIQVGGIEQLIVFIKQSDLVSDVCYTLWSVNRSAEATKAMIDSHLMIELERYTNPCNANDNQMTNITRLLCSLPKYGPKIFEPLKPYHIKFFCQGLKSTDDECVSWSAMALTCYPIDEELQKLFCSKAQDGPTNLMTMLDSKNENVILSGLNCVVTLGEIPSIRDAFIPAIHAKLQRLWKSDSPKVIQGVLKALGVLTLNNSCLEWTQKQNMIPDLLKYLSSTDPDYIVYAAKAIGTCCNQKSNLQQLMQLNGVRTLWSLMKSPYSAVQAAATRALVPFLKSPDSPTIVRTFVDGLDLLVGLLKSDDSDVQESACMAITEVARDTENLAFMTDLGLVELLSRLLSTTKDSVRTPLANAIGVAAAYGDNRHHFGQEGAVDPLVSYLQPPSNNPEVHAATAKALKALSEDAQNSKKLSNAGVVEYLLMMVSSTDRELQMAAAVAIRNIRTNRG
ncbi:Armadillo/beta-catenin-like repeat family protein [Trichomonas vaginalis G3]|uniref:Armadillo/beta-catenin-like repeat family protein n=1 Tax=Trichomonas vaginalis (strain ATCC PRA-98 / G3) TaxID=412133 RepID=A2DSI3_TRIV3|nr:armadillo repeat-containing protein 4 (armc4) family [Trichomonas vaginalis G3]EAY16563.1 Armadillo/beta-catenin-like repeat family protein [Trichomonas vaginalis G3]KAI5532932.1 armadillo repeat-containing protein 4 (armc4) family [Trichomonas vaginalis G3]|eukprot:XP_001328786.1 Armadillo/beta-catenin-like repeat family protein [Trichomonas vaginalis G3]